MADDEPIRYFMDQHVPWAVSEGLRRHGVDVLTAQDAQRCGLTDTEQLAWCATEDRVLVSFDSDFIALHYGGLSHAGIAWCPERKHSIGELIQALLLVYGVLDRQAMRNHVEHL